MALGSSSDRRWRAQRLRVLQRDQYSCYYCQKPANQVDHLLAKVRGGTDDMSNLVAACSKCNNAKGSRSISVFLERLHTPPVSRSNLHTTTLNSGVTGPCVGQSRQVGQR